MKAKSIIESLEFQRNQSPKEALSLGKWRDWEAIEGSVDYMVDNFAERRALASEWESPNGEKIFIDDAEIYWSDDYNGYVEILLSNGDIIDYTCKESKTYPQRHEGFYKNKIFINNQLIDDEDKFEKYQGSGSWIADLMNFYKDNYNEK